MNETAIIPPEPLLRTLAPAMRELGQKLRAWLAFPRSYPLSTLTQAALQGLNTDLDRQATALDVDRPLLVVMLMGGTGVGKSTLLNALAGEEIAEASFARPTTRDPVVYYHDSIRPERLEPALQNCRLAAHDRSDLQEKILVDTPDLDSNDLANREKLRQLLPIADVVLYVGSQEKYHDQLGWEIFLEQRRRRAFAFVLNKWDRCVHSPGGVRPDQDLLRDLEGQGFQAPLLFRTCAQHWVDRARNNGNRQPPCEGEQFQELLHWLEQGLTRLEIEAIKARGVSQLLFHLQQSLQAACPPDLSAAAAETKQAFDTLLEDEAAEIAEILLNTLDPHQREIEHHFAVEGQQRFHGMMALYLRCVHRLRYLGSTFRQRLSILGTVGQSDGTPTAWDLGSFSRNCISVASERHLDARGRALPNRLLVAADGKGVPAGLLAGPAEEAARLDWRYRFTQGLVGVLQDVEKDWVHPRGARRWLQRGIVLLGDWLPPLVLLAAVLMLLWRFFDPRDRGYDPHLSDLLLPLGVLLLVLIVLHVLIVLLLPVRWRGIRGEFRRRLERRIHAELAASYCVLPEQLAQAIRQERGQTEQLLASTREVADWLRDREQAAAVAGLYGA